MNTTSQVLRRGRSTRPIAAMPLEALRDARRLTQVQLAQLLRISQGAVSKAERRNDMFVSTLRDYVRAIGGSLEIRAVFPEGTVLIDQFHDKQRGFDRQGVASESSAADGTGSHVRLTSDAEPEFSS